MKILIFIIIIIISILSFIYNKDECDILNLARNYIKKTKDDWNYILPSDFFSKYYPDLEKNKNTDFILIDLRDSESFNKFHVKNAINIFWLNLLDENNLKKLPKDKKIFLICYVGHTSSQALVLLKCLGYDVVSIKFGYGISPNPNVEVLGWAKLQYPLINS